MRELVDMRMTRRERRLHKGGRGRERGARRPGDRGGAGVLAGETAEESLWDRAAGGDVRRDGLAGKREKGRKALWEFIRISAGWRVGEDAGGAGGSAGWGRGGEGPV